MTATSTALSGMPRMTLDEFLTWDGGGHVGKLELWNGVVRAMSPASATHAIIQANIAAAFTVHLRARKSPCRTGTAAPIVPPMGQRSNARASDIAVTGTPPTGGTFDDPILIVEVLSPGNENETRDSIQSLAGLTSLREVLVVQSTPVLVELYRRDAAGTWPRDPATTGPEGEIHLTSIDLLLSVAEIYEGTRLA